MKTSHKRLFTTLVVSALATTMLISPVFAANKVSTGLIKTDGPHTYIDFKGNWSGREAYIATYLAKYKIVALHYRDSPEHIQAIKAVNRYTVVLGYFNPLYGDEVGRAHPEWWLQDTSGQPRTDYQGTEQVMDLTKPGWRNQCVNICDSALRKGFDGLILDNGISSPAVYGWAGPSESQWQSSTIDLYKKVKAIAGERLVIYNGAYFIPGYVDAVDGWMDEGFPFYKGWGNSISFALDASHKGKLSLFYAQGTEAQRYFCYCSALLTDGYFYYAPTGGKWSDDYGINLGKALNQAHQTDGVWQRDYENGKVIVDPSTGGAQIRSWNANVQ
ncbi:MAG TPA: putative glycoside hydrolase [Candidatus Acidoferrum sp.]|nr:putative glycoside hydrolase [Candidatus Acidoferrum sp.]